jgi:hypothetical protein
VLIFVAGAGMGLFSAPNAAGIMNSVPARQRGAASGMLATFQNSGFVLSIGIFFSLMIAGLAATLPTALTHGLTAQGVPLAVAAKIGHTPPVASLFAAFLGYNPIRQLLGPTGVLSHLPPSHVALLTGKTFFPQLISAPFHHGLVLVFSMAMGLLVVAAIASAFRGGRYVYEEQGAPPADATPNGQAAAPPAAPATRGARTSGTGRGHARNGTADAESLAGTGQHETAE